MKSVYIHIPFCNTICSYCDFPKVYSSVCDKKLYLEALKKEIKTNYKNEIVNTIYIGGGTPSVLSIEELKKLLEITNLFKKNTNTEFTIECNIESIDEEKLKLLKKYNVNRISIGIESFDKKIISYLGRFHTKKEAIKKIKLVKKYFNNINIDLMYAIPNQSIKSLKRDIKTYLKLKIPHISYYSLIIEPHTKLYNENTDYIDEDIDCKMYKIITKKLKKYHHYEISNFSFPGYESKHNLVYWNNEEYYGFGAGASGYINGIRYSNTKNIHKYINGDYRSEENILSELEKMQEEMFLGLRKLDGVNMEKFEKRYHQKIEEVFDIDDLLKENILIKNNGYMYINKDNIYTSNDIMIRFVGD